MKFVVFLIVCSVFLLYPYFFLSNKPVHVSIDDFQIALVDLCKNNYYSIFEQPTFKELKQIHHYTGAKFTLYSFVFFDNLNISCIPPANKKELENNSEWLKIGFHASTSAPPPDTLFQHGLSIFNKTIKNRAKALRLHYFQASSKEITLLKSSGTTTLLGADDDRISYNLPQKLNSELIENDELLFQEITYKSTDFRIEKTMFPFFHIWKHLNDKEIILFTHEKELSSKTKFKFISTIYYLSLYNCKFIAE